jgi:hypothetical protein
MIMSVSMLTTGYGAAMPVSVVNLSMDLPSGFSLRQAVYSKRADI